MSQYKQTNLLKAFSLFFFVGMAEANMSDLFNKYSSIKQAQPEVTEQVDEDKSGSISTISAEASSGIHIKVPIHTDNPNVVPITVEFDSSIKDGDVLTMFDPKGVMVFKLEPVLEATIDYVSLRFRLMNHGQSKFVIDRKSGHSEYKDVDVINSDGYASIPNTASSDNDVDWFREVYKNKRIKTLFKNSMSRHGYISSVVYGTSIGPVKITMTPLLAENPYFAFEGDTPSAKVETIELSDERYSEY